MVLAPVLLLRRWPLPVLAATTAANALLITGGVAILPFGIMLGVASYFAAARLPRRVSIRAAVISAAALGGALIYTALTVHNAAVADEAVESLLPLMAGWFTGDSVAARRRYLAGLADQARHEQAAEAERARQQVREERVRIAREMHDVVAHTLAVITVQAGVGRASWPGNRRKPAPPWNPSRPSAGRLRKNCGSSSACYATKRTERLSWPRPRDLSTSRTWSKPSGPRAPRLTCTCPASIARSRPRWS